MASRRELQRLEDENRTVCQRLADTEVELSKKEDELKSTNLRKMELLNDLRDYQRRLKEAKCQLEKSEVVEQEARAIAQELRQSLEHCESSLREQAAASKSTTCTLQLEIRNINCKLAEKRDECEVLSEKLYYSEDLLSSLQGEKSKMARDGSSRLANLNQALLQVKQNVAELSEENALLQSRELSVQEQLHTLERQYQVLLAKTSPDKNASSCPEKPPSTPRHNSYSHHRPTTPGRPVPEETEVDSLHIENGKLSKQLQCLQENFQLMSSKTEVVKREKKELEQSLMELQAEFDRVLGEKADMELKLEETKAALSMKVSSMGAGRQREEELEGDVERLGAQLHEVKSEKSKLLVQVKTEQGKLAATDSLVRELQRKSKSLTAEKAQFEEELSLATQRADELEEEVDSHCQLKASRESAQRQEEAVTAYKAKLEKAMGEQSELEEMLCEANEILEEEKSRNAFLEHANKAMQRQLSGLEAAQKQLQRQKQQKSSLSAELAEMQQQLATLTDENRSLREECQQLQSVQRQSSGCVQEMERVADAKDRRAAEQQGVVRALREEVQGLETKLHCITTERSEKEAERLRLGRQIGELQLELENTRRARSHFEMETGNFVHRVEELEQHNFELSTKLSDAHNETALSLAAHSEKECVVEDLRRQLHNTKALLLEKESHVSELGYSHELLQAENADMLTQVTSLSEIVAARNAKIESLQTEVLCYESNTRDIMTQVMQLEEDHGQCSKAKRNLREELEQKNYYLEERERREKELEAQVKALRSELIQLRDDLSSLETAKMELNLKLRVQAENTKKLASSLQLKEATVQQLEQAVQEKESQLRSLRDELNFEKKASSDAQNSLRAEVNSLDRKCQEMRDRCEKNREVELQMQAETSQLQRQLQELRHINAELEKDRQPLQNRFDQLKSELTSVKDELYVCQKELKSTKSELHYQRRKRGEMQREMEGLQGEEDAVQMQFEQFQEELLKALDEGEVENTPGRRIKGFFKQSKKRVLKPLHNLRD